MDKYSKKVHEFIFQLLLHFGSSSSAAASYSSSLDLSLLCQILGAAEAVVPGAKEPKEAGTPLGRLNSSVRKTHLHRAEGARLLPSR